MQKLIVLNQAPWSLPSAASKQGSTTKRRGVVGGPGFCEARESKIQPTNVRPSLPRWAFGGCRCRRRYRRRPRTCIRHS